jgi:hypothetical protein
MEKKKMVMIMILEVGTMKKRKKMKMMKVMMIIMMKVVLEQLMKSMRKNQI